MRIGLIADIHGNLLALETVLAELARETCREWVFRVVKRRTTPYTTINLEWIPPSDTSRAEIGRP